MFIILTKTYALENNVSLRDKREIFTTRVLKFTSCRKELQRVVNNVKMK